MTLVPRRSLWRVLRSVVFAVTAGLLGLVAGEAKAPVARSAAEEEFRSLKALRDQEHPAGMIQQSDEWMAWSAARARELHARSLAFWEKYPNDPFRWDVWMLLSNGMFFMSEVKANGRVTLVRDLEQARAWRLRFERGVEDLLAAPDAGEHAKSGAFSHLLRAGTNWRSQVATPEGQKMLAKMTGWFEWWERECPKSLSLINGVQAMAEMLDAADPARCQRFLVELRTRYAADTPRDREIRAVVEGRLKLIQGEADPVLIQIGALDGRMADTRDYRGKLVLIALVSATWTWEMDFLRRTHDKYHAQGLEIIQVTGGDTLVAGAPQNTALETALVVDEKNYPWRVAWTGKRTLGEFARTLGLNQYPMWLLLSRDGRFVAKVFSRREATAAIERELLIKPEVPAAPALAAAVALASGSGAGDSPRTAMSLSAHNFSLDFATPVDPVFQAAVAGIDARLRVKLGIAENLTAVGVLDLQTLRLALVRPDAIDYAASVPKIGILLAWFQSHPEAVMSLDAATRRELGLMIKVSDNEMATKFSTQLGIARVQEVLNSYGLYDAVHGGGIWFGKHYGKGGERLVDPVGGHSHAATVRQLVRFYLLLEQGKLVSPAASAVMRELFASPEIAHLNDRFVKGLAGRGVEVRRKSGWWETWSHDTAVVTGAGRHYILVGMTHHEKGAAYLEELAAAVDDFMMSR